MVLEPPAVQETTELVALQRALERSQGFTLYAVRANTTVLRLNLINWLKVNLKRPLSEVNLQPDQPIFEQLAEAARGAPDGAVLSITGLENMPRAEDTDWLQRQLNWRRAAFRRLAHPLLVWLPEHLLRILMESVPDFFDWHSGFFEFTLPGEARAGEYAQAMSIWNRPMLARNPQERQERIAALRGLLTEYQEQGAERQAQAEILNTLGGLFWESGDARRAIEFYEQALAIDREIGDRRGEGNALGNLGSAWAALGDARRAIEYYEQALAIHCEIGDRRGEAIGAWNLGLALEKQGEFVRAAEMMQIRVDFERAIRHPDAEKHARRLEEVRRKG